MVSYPWRIRHRSLKLRIYFQLNLPNKLKKLLVVIIENSSKDNFLRFDKNFTVCII